jgi:LmbE family N-acetylglucosaminyl deacetylase
MPKFVYLSPHLDDAVLSCGAFLWKQVHIDRQPAEVWTIFAGDPPAGELSPFARELHARWQTDAEAPASRRAEDVAACAILGCTPMHLAYADCIYRSLPGGTSPRIEKNMDLFQYDPAKDLPLARELSEFLKSQLPADCALVVPLGVGGHIDHIVTRTAAEILERPLWYYADFPYSADCSEEIREKLPAHTIPCRFDTPSEAMTAWKQAIAAYRTQISSFWLSLEDMEQTMEEYAHTDCGKLLWQRAGAAYDD